jgi:hypothetical protein
VVIDGNGVVVVQMAEAAVVLQKAQRLLETEHLLQEKIKTGATIGELVNVDEIFRTTFSYQNKALDPNELPDAQCDPLRSVERREYDNGEDQREISSWSISNRSQLI